MTVGPFGSIIDHSHKSLSSLELQAHCAPGAPITDQRRPSSPAIKWTSSIAGLCYISRLVSAGCADRQDRDKT
eukprot:9693155-Heterocapsa_arctica.AAC.1